MIYIWQEMQYTINLYYFKSIEFTTITIWSNIWKKEVILFKDDDPY